MKITKTVTTGVLCLAAMAGGQAHASDAYAYVHATVAPSTDVLVSVPVNNNVEVELTALSRSGSVITVANSPAFAAGDFNAGAFPKYYIRVLDGSGAGLWASIIANSETTITVDDASVAALVANGNKFRVYKHHTVASVFPDALLNSAFVDGTQLLFYSSADSQNKAPGSGGIVNYTTFFNLGWGANADRPLKPEEAFVIRNSSGTTLTYVAVGIAPDHAVAYMVKPGVAKDTAVGTGYPVGVTVAETGLGTVNGRSILLQGTAQNSAPGSAAVYNYTTSFGLGWGANAGVTLAPNSGFVFRQPGSDTGGKATVVKPY